MLRTFAAGLVLAAGVVSAAPPAKPAPVAAKTVTLAPGTLADVTAELTKQAELPFDLGSVDGKTPIKAAAKAVPFWEAVEAVTDDAKCFASVQGGKVKFAKRPNGVGAAPSSIDGPFRVVLKKVVAKKDFEAAGTDYELHLEVQWEPRFPVYLIDDEPKATATVGKEKLTADSPSVRGMPTGYTHPAVVRLKNVPRGAKQIDELTGTFRLVAAAKMLAVEFTDLTGDKPVSHTVEGVKVTLHPVKKSDKVALFRVDAEYPEGHPEFESFQLWHGTNTFRLFPPNNREGWKPTDLELGEGGRRPSVEYHFAGPNGGAFTLPDLKGWRAVYDTPCPMSEQTLTFKLKGIDLP